MTDDKTEEMNDEERWGPYNREIVGTDVELLAKGYWRKHFMWRIHPKTRVPAALAALSGLLLLLALVTGTSVAQRGMPLEGVDLLVLLLGLTLIASVAWLVFIFLETEDGFVEYATQRWEQEGWELPGRDSVLEYLEQTAQHRR